MPVIVMDNIVVSPIETSRQVMRTEDVEKSFVDSCDDRSDLE